MGSPRTARAQAAATLSGPRVGEAAFALAALAITTLVAIWTLDASGAVSTVPLYYGATVPSRFPFDLNFQIMLVQGLLENGWYQSNPRLGAPFGQKLYDFPLGGENLQFLWLKAIGAFAAQPGTAVNAYLLLTFPLTALSAYGALRWLRASRGAALVASVLFALLPYHFLRGEYHLFLSGYFSVPIGALLILSVLAGERLFPRREPPSRGLRAYASRRSLAVVAGCVLVGSTSVYYAVLTVMLLLLAAPLAAVVRREGRTMLEALAAVALIGCVLLVNLAPSVVHRLDEGANTVVAVRNPGESELYSVKLTQLLLPSPHHRLEGLAELGRRYTSSQPLLDEQTATLGLVAAAGFVWLLAVALASALGRRAAGAGRHRQVAVAALIAFFVGTTGGISALISYYVSAQLRAYNRVSVFIAFFSLVAVAWLLDSLRERLTQAGRPRSLAWALMAAVLVVGVLDQTSPRFTPDVARARAEYRHDARFVGAIEQRLPKGASVLQLPVFPFPESPPLFRLMDYDLARGYIHSRDLRWSYGAVKGRPAADWQARLVGRPMKEVLPGVVAIGFSGVYVDRAGFADAGRALEADLRRVIKTSPLENHNRRLAFYDLRPYARLLRERRTPRALNRVGAALVAPAQLPSG